MSKRAERKARAEAKVTKIQKELESLIKEAVSRTEPSASIEEVCEKVNAAVDMYLLEAKRKEPTELHLYNKALLRVKVKLNESIKEDKEK